MNTKPSNVDWGRVLASNRTSQDVARIRARSVKIAKAAGVASDLSTTPVDALVRQFVSGDPAKSDAAAREIATRFCAGAMAGMPSMPVGGAL